MVYPIKCMLGGFSFKESMILWKQKLQLFNPNTYMCLKLIYLYFYVQWMKVQNFFTRNK